jgi:hypothetical protein
MGAVVMSLMTFKKPYYILPVLPAFVLLMAPVIERYACALRVWLPAVRLGRVIGMASLVIALTAVCAYGLGADRWVSDGVIERFVSGAGELMSESPAGALAGWALLLVAACALFCTAIGFALAHKRLVVASWAFAYGVPLVFLLGWYTIGPAVDDVERTAALDSALDEAGVPALGPVYWVDQRPDSRLGFYFGRASTYLIAPADIVVQMSSRTGKRSALEIMALGRAVQLLGDAQPVYLILDREHLPSLSMLPRDVAMRVQIVGTIDMDGSPDGDDWVIVTNGAVTHGERQQPGSSVWRVDGLMRRSIHRGGDLEFGPDGCAVEGERDDITAAEVVTVAEHVRVVLGANPSDDAQVGIVDQDGLQVIAVARQRERIPGCDLLVELRAVRRDEQARRLLHIVVEELNINGERRVIDEPNGGGAVQRADQVQESTTGNNHRRQNQRQGQSGLRHAVTPFHAGGMTRGEWFPGPGLRSPGGIALPPKHYAARMCTASVIIPQCRLTNA